LPDPVSCHPTSQNPSIIQCDDVVIGPEPNPPTAVETRSSSPGVRALVQGQTLPWHVQKEVSVSVHVDVPASELVTECSGKAIGVGLAIAAAGGGNPLIAAIGAFKAGLDVGQCIAKTMNGADQRATEERAIEMCREDGGTPIGTVADELICEMPTEPVSR